MNKLDLSQEDILRIFKYEDDILKNRYTRHYNCLIDEKAGSINPNGYFACSVNSKLRYIHRIVWIYHNGDIPHGYEIDHKDRNRGNNSISNLRLTTRSINNENRQSKGYYLHQGKYRAVIKVNKKKIELGMFSTEIEAGNAYWKAKEKYHNATIKGYKC